MTSPSVPDARFASTFEVIEGGRGLFKAMISLPGQGDVPSYQFNQPRRLLRVRPDVPIHPRMVVKSQAGTLFPVGEHGAAEARRGVVYRNFRLFEITGHFAWQGASKVIDPTTKLPKTVGVTPKGLLWGAFEPGPEERDRGLKMRFETGRFITNTEVPLGDQVDGREVIRCDQQLGLWLLSLG